MKPIFYYLTILSLVLSACAIPVEDPLTEQDYIDAWKKFHPSKALRQGMHDAAFFYEDRSEVTILEWQAFNRQMLSQLTDEEGLSASQDVINRRLLKVQIERELYLWENEKPQSQSLSFYTNLIDRAFHVVWSDDFLTGADKARLICNRLQSVEKLCQAGTQQLETIKKDERSKGLEVLQKNKQFYQEELPKRLKEAGINTSCDDLENLRIQTIEGIQEFEDFLKGGVQTDESVANTILGRTEYARQLNLYLDMPSSPEQLADQALQEIKEVRQLIGKKSLAYFRQKYPNQAVPESIEEVIQITFADMENDAPANG